MQERKAFDTSLYSKQANRTAIVSDLASLVIETSAHSHTPSVNPFTLTALPDGRVVDPNLGEQDVSRYYSEETELDRKEKEAGLKLRDCLLREPDGTLAVWISPPGGPIHYNAGVITVGFNRKKDGTKELESYGIGNIHITSKQCMEIAKILADCSGKDLAINDPEDLRNTVFTFIPPGSPWAYLRSIIGQEDVWNSIESGQAHRLKKRAQKDAKQAIREAERMMEISQSEYAHILTGTYLEISMKQKGWDMSSGSCGRLNSDLIFSTSDFIHTHIAINTTGESVIVIKSGKYVISCGNCGKAINKVIKTGYKCICGSTYKGC